MQDRSGLFSFDEFSFRGSVLKLAPDAFVTINGAIGSRVLSPADSDGRKSLDVKGGITSITVNAAVAPAGASRATIEVTAPMFRGMHEDYYVNLPNGTKVPFFMPMMEVKIFMKGRFLESGYSYEPRYYPVFWGMITNVSESYSGGSNNFSITCEDILAWWKYQKINLRPSSTDMVSGSPIPNVITIFENLDAWQTIYALFFDSFFSNPDALQANQTTSPLDNQTGNSRSDFLYPQYNSAKAPTFLDHDKVSASFGPMTRNVASYWNTRFGFSSDNATGIDNSKVPLEMYGFKGLVSLDTYKSELLSFKEGAYSEKAKTQKSRFTLDYNLLAQVLPYQIFKDAGGGSEPMYATKLEIAQKVCELVQMEFFVDTNGSFVFKPPFYNIDVASGDSPYYKISPDEIISFSHSINSDNICNYLKATAPMYRPVTGSALEVVGYHIDWESIKRYGIRYQEVSIPFGQSDVQLNGMAAAEVGRINAKAWTGNVSVPLRPEMRLGYPVYIRHLDCYYYVAGITHSINFGQSATTDLSLEAKRERVFDDGTSGVGDGQPGSVLKHCVWRYQPDRYSYISGPDFDTTATTDDKISQLAELAKKVNLDSGSSDGTGGAGGGGSELPKVANDIMKDDLRRQLGFLKGPGTLGPWVISEATLDETGEKITNSDQKTAVSSSELVMMTNDTIPFTDKEGYRHIGAFPYGANMVLTKNRGLWDKTDKVQKDAAAVAAQQNATPQGQDTPPSTAQAATDGVPAGTTPNTQTNTAPPEQRQAQFTSDLVERLAAEKRPQTTTALPNTTYVAGVPARVQLGTPAQYNGYQGGSAGGGGASASIPK